MLAKHLLLNLQGVLELVRECPFSQQHPDAFPAAMAAALQQLPLYLHVVLEGSSRAIEKVSCPSTPSRHATRKLPS